MTRIQTHSHFHAQALDVVEALLQVGLHGLRVLSLAQDLQHVIVGQEVESREDLPLSFQIHVQSLLDLLQLDAHLCQLLQQA